VVWIETFAVQQFERIDTAVACLVRFCPAMARSASCAAWSRLALVMSTEKDG
jgi:hypothetical protein